LFSTQKSQEGGFEELEREAKLCSYPKFDILSGVRERVRGKFYKSLGSFTRQSSLHCGHIREPERSERGDIVVLLSPTFL